tara:strand:+ start:1796 stop:2389 length:594 start_codon:yes stop_codon:yes gene_type:complete
MENLEYFLNERSGEEFKPKKNKWTKFTPDKIKDKDGLSDEFIELIKTAYAPIGGHVKFQNKEDVFNDKSIEFWEGVDLHDSPDFDVIVFGKNTKYGVKLTGVGHDGQKDSKREYLQSKIKMLSKTGYFNEISGKLADILISKDVPFVTDEKDVEKVLGKKIEWHGKHPDGKSEGDGWYTRKIAGKEHIKILAGKPKI